MQTLYQTHAHIEWIGEPYSYRLIPLNLVQVIKKIHMPPLIYVNVLDAFTINLTICLCVCTTSMSKN